MKLFVTYNPTTGLITGRYSVTDGLEKLYPHRIMIDKATYDAEPERLSKIDLNTMAFTPLTTEEAAVVNRQVAPEQVTTDISRFNPQVVAEELPIEVPPVKLVSED